MLLDGPPRSVGSPSLLLQFHSEDPLGIVLGSVLLKEALTVQPLWVADQSHRVISNMDQHRRAYCGVVALQVGLGIADRGKRILSGRLISTSISPTLIPSV